MNDFITSLLVKHGIIAAEAIEDPAGYDNGMTLERVDAFIKELRENPNA